MNCKAGDLALVIGPAQCPAVGKIVKCMEFVPSNTRITSADQLWTASTTADAWITDTLLFPPPRFLDWGDINYSARDQDLMPIRPPASNESDTADQDLPAECGA